MRRGADAVLSVLLKSASKDLINSQDEIGRTAFAYVVEKGRLVMIRLLLDAGADITIPDNNGTTVLHGAGSRNQHDVVAFLLHASSSLGDEKRQAFLDHKNMYGKTALIDTAERNLTELMILLLRSNASYDLADNNKNTVIHWAVSKGKDDTASLNVLIEHIKKKGEDPRLMLDRRNHYGKTPLVDAVERKKKSCVLRFLEAGADITLIDNEGSNALHWAVKSESPEIAEILLKHAVSTFGDASCLLEQALTPGATPVAKVSQITDKLEVNC